MEKRKLIQGHSPYQKKLAEKASYIFRPPHKEPFGGVRKGRVREGSVEGPYGRSLSVPPDYGDSTVSRIINLKIKIINIIKKRLFRLVRN